MQRTGADGISGIGGNNMGVVTARSVANFLTKTTIVLATLFMINAIILANISSRKNPSLSKKIEAVTEAAEKTTVPIAK